MGERVYMVCLSGVYVDFYKFKSTDTGSVSVGESGEINDILSV